MSGERRTQAEAIRLKMAAAMSEFNFYARWHLVETGMCVDVVVNQEDHDGKQYAAVRFKP